MVIMKWEMGDEDKEGENFFLNAANILMVYYVPHPILN